MAKPWTRASINITYDLQDVLHILDQTDCGREFETRKLGLSVVDHFLFCGKFNSVLGQDGFGLFKDRLKEVLKKVNDDDFGANYINLDKMFEALLRSGVYYLEEYLPTELHDLKKNVRWLTAYRYIAKNFPNITYKDFREVVKRFQETSGHSIYVTATDSEGLQEMGKRTKLFHEVVDFRAALLPLSQKQLREICEKIGVSPARSIEDTVNRIIESVGDDAARHVPEEYRFRRSLMIKDTELATGQDIIDLDAYLRAIAKVVREELAHFINQRRRWSLFTERDAA